MKKRKLFGLLCSVFAIVYFTGCPDPDPTEEEVEKTIVCTIKDDEGNTLVTQDFDMSKIKKDSVNIEYLGYKENVKKTGYTFLKLVDADGNEVKEISTDTTLYVVYSPITYTVKFDKGVGQETDEGKLPEEFTVKYDEEFTLPDNKLSYSGKKAVGWYMKTGESGSIKERHSNGDKLKNLKENNNESVTFIADFNDYDCVITFKVPKIKSYGIDYDQKVFNLDKDSALPEVPELPARTGYITDGWVEEKDTTNTVVDFTDYKVTKTVTYKAKYTPKSYKVTFTTAHGTAPEAVTVYADTTLKELYKEPYKLSASGYNFEGWFDEKNNKHQVLAWKADEWKDGDLKDLTLTAKWTPWKIHLYFVGASQNLESLPEGYYYDSSKNLICDVDYNTEITMPGSELYSLPNGFRLLGWSKERNYTGFNNYNENHKLDYATGSSFKNEIAEDGKKVDLYGYVEGPAIKISKIVPASVTLDENADVKPSAENNTFCFTDVKLKAKENGTGEEITIPLVSFDSYKLSSYVIKKDGYYVLNSKFAEDYKDSNFFKEGTWTYKLEARFTDSTRSSWYESEKSVSITSGNDIVLDFNNLTFRTEINSLNYGYWQLDFMTDTDVSVSKIQFDGSNYSVTNNKWSLCIHPSYVGTKEAIVYITKNGTTYQSSPVKIQTAAGCISYGTFIVTNDLQYVVTQEVIE